jgi:DNA-binding NarL/FixJ family response regulator
MVLERNKRKNTPVVIFSSSAREPEIKRALRAGAREYIKKPSDLDEFTLALIGIITKWGFTAP